MHNQDIWESVYVRNRKRRTLWKKAVNFLACIVVFCTTYALILPAITKEQTAYCGQAEHVHEASCYLDETTASEQRLVCTEAEAEPHKHTDDCYLPAHKHMDGCYTLNPDNLICEIAESEGHTHLDDCYGEAEKVLVCKIPESPGHRHEDGCYEEDTQKLICNQEESEGYAHSDSCYDENGELICELEEFEGHQHTDECYETVAGALICTQAEAEGHTHLDDCYQLGEPPLICKLEESQEHFHDVNCYSSDEEVLVCTIVERTEPELICTSEETEGHHHTAECYETVVKEAEPQLICEQNEHTHDLACYSNPEADVESQTVWEATLPKELSPIWEEALVAVAESQLGYSESAANYQVQNKTEIYGYSRYGAWAGDAYGNWDAYFVEFCLHYAEIPETEFASFPDAQEWMETLKLNDRFISDTGYLPKPGDVVFLRIQDRPMVGIVLACDESGYITAAIGDYENRVEKEIFAPGAQEILGYAIMPSNRQPEPEIPEAEIPEADLESDDDLPMEEAESSELVEEGGFFTGELFAYESEIDGAYVTIATLELAKDTIQDIRLVPVDLSVAPVSTESNTSVTKNRVLDRRMYQIQFLDENGNLLTDVRNQELEIMLSWETPLAGFENADTQTLVYVHNENQAYAVDPIDLTASEALISLTGLDAGSQVDIMVVDSGKLEEGVHGSVHVKYNYQRDAFIYDSAYAKYYNADSPLGTAGSFHIVAFTKATLSPIVSITFMSFIFLSC